MLDREHLTLLRRSEVIMAFQGDVKLREVSRSKSDGGCHLKSLVTASQLLLGNIIYFSVSDSQIRGVKPGRSQPRLKDFDFTQKSDLDSDA